MSSREPRCNVRRIQDRRTDRTETERLIEPKLHGSALKSEGCGERIMTLMPKFLLDSHVLFGPTVAFFRRLCCRNLGSFG